MTHTFTENRGCPCTLVTPCHEGCMVVPKHEYDE